MFRYFMSSMQSRRVMLFLVCVVAGTAANVADAQAPAASTTGSVAGEWPQFLGPHRNGLSSETNLLDRWPDQGPKVLWRVPGGVGMSGIAISRGRAFTLVQRDGKQLLVALNAESGQPIWQREIAPDYKNAMGDGPRATPAVHGDVVLVFTGEGILAAIDTQTGRTLWSHPIVTELSGKAAEYGMASSPLVAGDLVVVTAGAPKATLAAYEIKSGKQRWTAGSADPAGYSSPALLNLAGRMQVVAFTGNSAIAADPQSGALLWRYPFETTYECNIATPLEWKGQVFLSSGENHGSVLLSLKPTGDRFELGTVWSSLGTESVMRNEWQTSMLLDGYLYGMDNIGSAGPVTHLSCISAATGERKWQQLRFGKGNLIAADGKLFISTMKGELVVVRANPERYDEIGRSMVLGPTRQAPSLANGKLYLRDDQEIVCLDVRKP